MLNVLLFLFSYMLYGVLLTVFMAKFKIFNAHKEIKVDQGFLFSMIILSPIITVAIIVYILPIRLFRYLMGMDVIPEDTDKQCSTYSLDEMKSTKL